MGNGPVYKIQKLGEHGEKIILRVTQKHVTPTDAGGGATRRDPSDGY